MALFDKLPRGIRRLLRLPATYERRMRDLDDEIRFHIESHVAKLRASGASQADAEKSALEQFGDADDLRTYCSVIAAKREPGRRMRQSFGELAQDVRYALRQIARTPAFTATAAMILAVGIGANTGVFSVVNHLLISPFPFVDGNRMVAILATSGGGKIFITPSTEMVETWHARARTVQDMVVFEEHRFTLGDSTRGQTRSMPGAAVPPNMIPFVGIKPLFGRGIVASDTLADAPPVVVIGEALWRSDFAEARSAIGRTLLINGEAHTIVGVMPEKFFIPFSGIKDILVARRHGSMGRPAAIAKLRPGVTIKDANREIASLLPPKSEFNPYGDPPTIAREIDLVGRQRKQMVLLLFGAVGVVLLIACANVANLLLARSWARQREFTVRIALGAGRWRIVRQVLTESLLLASLAGALGIGISFLVLNGIRAALPGGGTDYKDVHIEPTVLAWSVAISVVTGIIFGVGPALAAATSNASDTLKTAARTSTGGSVARRVRFALVVGEVAFSVVLLSGAGLLFRTLVALDGMNVGFESHNLADAYIMLPPTAASNATARAAAWQAVRDGVRSIPGVRGATFAMTTPADFDVAMGGLEVEGRTLGPSENLPTYASNHVTADFFALTGIPIKQGRGLSDGASNEAMVNEALARRLWPSASPLGARIRQGARRPWLTIVGITGDVRLPSQQNDRLNRDLQVYNSFQGPDLSATLLIRSDIPLAALDSTVRRLIRDVNPAFRLVHPMAQTDRTIAAGADAQRFVLRLIGAFALFAVLLAAVGLHGVIAYAVNQRTREIGVRVALGAQARDVTRLVLSQGLALGVGGVVIGVAGAAAATRLLRTFLYGVKPGDPVTLAVVGVVLLGVALLATYAPARRAARLDPVEALRTE